MLLSIFLFYLILLAFSVVYLLYPLVKPETSFLNFFDSETPKKSSPKSSPKISKNSSKKKKEEKEKTSEKPKTKSETKKPVVKKTVTQKKTATTSQKKSTAKSTTVKKTTKRNSVKLVFTLLFLFVSNLEATTFNLDIQNITTQSEAKNIESVKILELSQGMQALQEKKNTRGKVTFENVELKANTQYMVQVDYRGVLYNKTIVDLSQKEISLQIQVSDVTHNFEEIAKQVDYRKIIYVTYRNESLAFNIVTSFENGSNKSFTEKEGGVYISLPSTVENLESSVPLGGKNSSQLMWLPLDAKPAEKKSGMYILPHPLKPGFKIYQTTFSVPYSSKTFSFVLQQEYPTENPVILKLASEGITLKMQEDENWQPIFTDSEEIGEIINLPLKKKMTLVFKGGTPQPVQEQPRRSDTPIEVESPLTNLQKAGFIISSIIIFFLAFLWLKQNTELLSLLWLREEKRLQKEIEEIKNSTLPKNEKDAQIKVLKNQLEILQKKINEE